MRGGIWAVAAVVAAVALSGCGGGSGGDEASQEVPTSEARPTTTNLTTSTTRASTTTTVVVTSTTTLPPTTVPPPVSPTWDELKGASIPAMCMHGPTTLVDGKDQSLGPNEGMFELRRTFDGGGAALIEGIPSDAGPLTAVVATCNAGGVGWPNPVLFFAPGGRFYAATFLDGPRAGDAGLNGEWQAQWDASGGGGPARDGVYALERTGDAVTVTLDAELPEDPSCCPTGAVAVTIRPLGGAVELVGIESALGD